MDHSFAVGHLEVPRLIGVEVRFRAGWSGYQEELFITPCDITLPADAVGRGLNCELTLTAHLNIGDRNGTIAL